ncbi:MAG: hypothetical protein AAGD11_01705 [Planctomycetota bacterium]
MSESIHILLAAGDLWEMVIGAIFFIMWTIAQLLGSRQEAKAKKKQKQRPRPQPKPVDMDDFAAPAPAGPRNQEDALRSEVEEFLRRAQGRPEPQKAQTTTKPPQMPPPRDRAQPTRVAKELPRKKRPKTLRNEGVAEHVERHLGTADLAPQSEKLATTVAQSDERLDAHLHEKFDHDLGSLQHRDGSSPAAPAADNAAKDDVAGNIAEMLRSPQGMRQLIIANEVLRRPEW